MQVGISNEYFAKGLLDYENWKWAWGRELMQNGVDAGANSIEFFINFDGTNTIARCVNDAPPMSRDVLIDKFLNIGGSTKGSDGNSVGGFGIAKTVIALAHNEYDIRTGSFKVRGSGGSFDLEENLPEFSGTETVVQMKGNVESDLKDQIRSLCYYAQTPVQISLNGEVLEANHNKGSNRRDLGFGVVYTSKRASNRMVVRISGIPMFVSYANVNRLVTVELAGTSSEVLTSNRDGLVHPYRGELSSFVTELAVDKKSALAAKQPRYIHYSGDRFSHEVRSKVNTAAFMLGVDYADDAGDESVVLTYDTESQEIVAVDRGGEDQVEFPEVNARENVALTPKSIVSNLETSTVKIDTEFVIKNGTNLSIPNYYKPECSSFSTYSQKLARIWGRLMLQMHRTMGHSDDFAIGFIFQDDGTMAEYERASFGKVYYIAPAVVVEQSSTASKSFKKAWKLTDRGLLLATAAHEFVHGACGYGIHGEGFASKYTEVMGTVMDRKKDFSWCFR